MFLLFCLQDLSVNIQTDRNRSTSGLHSSSTGSLFICRFNSGFEPDGNSRTHVSLKPNQKKTKQKNKRWCFLHFYNSPSAIKSAESIWVSLAGWALLSELQRRRRMKRRMRRGGGKRKTKKEEGSEMTKRQTTEERDERGMMRGRGADEC